MFRPFDPTRGAKDPCKDKLIVCKYLLAGSTNKYLPWSIMSPGTLYPRVKCHPASGYMHVIYNGFVILLSDPNQYKICFNERDLNPSFKL